MIHGKSAKLEYLEINLDDFEGIPPGLPPLL